MTMRSSSIAILAAGALACPANALTPAMPQCSRAELAPQETGYEGYAYSIAGNGFVSYERRLLGGGRWEFILEHCPSRQRLTVFVTGGDESLNRQSLYNAIAPVLAASESEKAYTLQDLGRLARDAGAEAGVARAGYLSCVCAQLGY
ncbi:hypothetical protein P1J78_15100 [Psychromarinibacter sp. C21-152]|uniref:Uncharacterized protein n=1 Tax=Psychromarinibacter sediminicola TaxID=3033385 RepID=A0AAE3NRA6_9RHOB|nr:hypothetical protein [Psychromarinibacter sediminicola]MDF0602068.1 hypothetical protein [Psychromarinibacter sediminicola]